MQRRTVAAAIIAMWLICAGCETQHHSSAGGSKAGGQGLISDTTELRRKVESAKSMVYPTLVNIMPVSEVFQNGRKQRQLSTGSGAIISPEGYVVTNHHVAGEGISFICTLASKQDVPATLVGTDIFTDLAVLKLDLSKINPRNLPLPVARFGDSGAMFVGDTVLAMGSPLSLSQSMTQGIISNMERVFITERGGTDGLTFEYGQPTGIYNQWIQHDAPINPGNSGGPLVNLKGEIIGINTRGGGENIAFAIPAAIARQVADELIRTGRVTRSWIGVQAQPTKLSAFDHGVLVASVEDNSPAAVAGIKAGDLIVQVDGQPINVRYAADVPGFYKMVADAAVGSTMKFTVERAGETLTMAVVTESQQRVVEHEDEFKEWGFTAANISRPMAQRLKIVSTDGIIITGIRQGYPAHIAKPGLQEGGILRKINGKPITDLESFRAEYTPYIGQEASVLLEMETGNVTQLCVLKCTKDEDKDAPKTLRKAWIGIENQVLTQELAGMLKVPQAGGVRVTAIYPETEAAKSGLRIGDLITHLNGSPIPAMLETDTKVLENKIKELNVGDTAKLTVIRDGATMELPLPLESSPLPASEAKTANSKDFDLKVRAVVFDDWVTNKWPSDIKGVIVAGVDQTGWAGLAGLRPGDLIQEIHGMEVKGTKSFKEAMDKIKELAPDKVAIFVQRRGGTRYIYADCDWEK